MWEPRLPPEDASEFMMLGWPLVAVQYKVQRWAAVPLAAAAKPGGLRFSLDVARIGSQLLEDGLNCTCSDSSKLGRRSHMALRTLPLRAKHELPDTMHVI